MSHSSDNLTFWDHLDVLRSTLMRICIVAVVFMLVAFCFKDEVFAIIFAPRDTSFPTYRLFDQISVLMGHTADASDFAVSLINTELTRQFMVHLQVSLWVGL
ncbi:MAG: twin-arginine translocase subunit TatC, partial [Muribaculaceae bacterium]|nr:twin-arginine translocase subunit TatC [Muribaculaceae bacterium]